MFDSAEGASVAYRSVDEQLPFAVCRRNKQRGAGHREAGPPTASRDPCASLGNTPAHEAALASTEARIVVAASRNGVHCATTAAAGRSAPSHARTAARGVAGPNEAEPARTRPPRVRHLPPRRPQALMRGARRGAACARDAAAAPDAAHGGHAAASRRAARPLPTAHCLRRPPRHAAACPHPRELSRGAPLRATRSPPLLARVPRRRARGTVAAERKKLEAQPLGARVHAATRGAAPAGGTVLALTTACLLGVQRREQLQTAAAARARRQTSTRAGSHCGVTAWKAGYRYI